MKKILLFIAGMLFTFISIYRNIKIENIENRIVTINIWGLDFSYYYESEE